MTTSNGTTSQPSPERGAGRNGEPIADKVYAAVKERLKGASK